MNEIIKPEKHNFELAKNRLKEFAEIKDAELSINKVRTDGGFLGMGNHKVTGDELNDRMEVIQNHLININATNNKTIKEFREVYNALDALDKDYMTCIAASVKALEKTSIDVKKQQGVLSQHNSKLQEQQNKLNFHQDEIDKIIDNIKKTVSVLKSFKEKLDGLKHLSDIDRIWADCKMIYDEVRIVSDSLSMFIKTTNENNQENTKRVEGLKNSLAMIEKDHKTIHNEICVVSDSLSMSIKAANESNQENEKKVEVLRSALTVVEKKNEDLFNQLYDLNEKLESVVAFTTMLEQIIHLRDIDKIWELLSSAHNSISSLSSELELAQDMVSKNQENINSLLDFMERLCSLEHLMEVDDIWKQTEEHTCCIQRLEKEGNTQKNKVVHLVKDVDKLCERVDLSRYDISCLKEYKEKLGGLSHLEDVDDIWKNVEKNTSRLTESEKKDEELTAVIKKNKEEIDEKIADTVQTVNETVQSLLKRIKYAYLIAGGSAGLAIIELMLLFMKVV